MGVEEALHGCIFTTRMVKGFKQRIMSMLFMTIYDDIGVSYNHEDQHNADGGNDDKGGKPLHRDQQST